MKPEIAKIGQSFARFQEGDFTLVKTDKSEQEKIYAKIYPSKIPTTDFSCRFWELCESSGENAASCKKKKKQPILRQKDLVNMPLRGQVVFSIKHLFAEMLKQSPALWMKFWWRKLCKANQLLMNMRTNMKFRSEASPDQEISFQGNEIQSFSISASNPAANLNIGHRLPIFIVFAFFPVFFDFFSGGEIIPSVQFFFHFIFKPLFSSSKLAFPTLLLHVLLA